MKQYPIAQTTLTVAKAGSVCLGCQGLLQICGHFFGVTHNVDVHMGKKLKKENLLVTGDT